MEFIWTLEENRVVKQQNIMNHWKRPNAVKQTRMYLLSDLFLHQDTLRPGAGPPSLNMVYPMFLSLFHSNFASLVLGYQQITAIISSCQKGDLFLFLFFGHPIYLTGASEG